MITKLELSNKNNGSPEYPYLGLGVNGYTYLVVKDNLAILVDNGCAEVFQGIVTEPHSMKPLEPGSSVTFTQEESL